jgi:hypothetical protein
MTEATVTSVARAVATMVARTLTLQEGTTTESDLTMEDTMMIPIMAAVSIQTTGVGETLIPIRMMATTEEGEERTMEMTMATTGAEGSSTETTRILQTNDFRGKHVQHSNFQEWDDTSNAQQQSVPTNESLLQLGDTTTAINAITGEYAYDTFVLVRINVNG